MMDRWTLEDLALATGGPARYVRIKETGGRLGWGQVRAAFRVPAFRASALAYFINDLIATARFAKASEMNFESPLTSLVWITSIISIVITYAVSSVIIPELGGDPTQWWKLATIISCGTLAGAVIPELVKV